MLSLPTRARLPSPLPTTVLRSPGGTLDALTLTFRDREDCVMVESAATQCSATFWCAVGEGLLSYDGEDEEYPCEVPITPDETSLLEGYADLASEWDAAVKASDKAGLRRLAGRIEAMPATAGFRVRVNRDGIA